MRTVIFLGCLVIIAGGLALWIRPTAIQNVSGTGSATPNRQMQQSVSTRSAGTNNTAVIVAPGRTLESREFVARFGLSDVENFKYRKAMSALATELVELKGLGAEITSYGGNTLKMMVPRLNIPEDELEKHVATTVVAATSENIARDILSDPDGFSTVLSELGMELLKGDASYTFTKVRAEDNPARNGSSGYAAFDLVSTITHPADTNSNSRIPKMSFKGFTFANADSIGLGWNAMSKAPTGFFRSEPITGTGSRPASAPWVIMDAASDRVEILNSRYPGSTDTLIVPRE